MIDLSDLLKLAIESLPQRVFPDAPHERDGGDDEGSDRQVTAENAFYEALCSFLARCGTQDSSATWDAFETFCLKATTRERIKEGVRLAVEADNE